MHAGCPVTDGAALPLPSLCVTWLARAVSLSPSLSPGRRLASLSASD